MRRWMILALCAGCGGGEVRSRANDPPEWPLHNVLEEGPDPAPAADAAPKSEDGEAAAPAEAPAPATDPGEAPEDEGPEAGANPDVEAGAHDAPPPNPTRPRPTRSARTENR